jgi:hypothetical protein
MTSRVPMVSLEHARELGEAMGLPARRTQSEAFRVLANNPGVARVAYSQLIQLLDNNKLDTRLRELMIMRIGWVTGSRLAELRAIDAGGQGDPRRYRRVPRRQIDFACCLGRGRKACHRPGTAGRIHHCHGQLDDVFPVVPELADTTSGGFDDLAARWSGLPVCAGIRDRQRWRRAYCGFSCGRW